MLTAFVWHNLGLSVRNLLLSRGNVIFTIEPGRALHRSKLRCKPNIDGPRSAFGPDTDDDPNLEMYEVADKVLCDWHCCRWILWASDATASMASTPHMALFPHSR